MSASALRQYYGGKTKFAAFSAQSESTVTKYTIYLYSDGSMSSDCPDWMFQGKARTEKIGKWRGEKRCKHTEPLEMYVDEFLSGKLKVDKFGGVLINPDGTPKDPRAKATPFTIQSGDAGPIETNLRKRFVRG